MSVQHAPGPPRLMIWSRRISAWFRRNERAVTALAGIASVLMVAVGLFLTNAANRTQQRLIEQGQVTERFSRAIDQLGSSKPDVRLGGIYLLDRLMRDSPADEDKIMAVLCAYIRQHAPDTTPTRLVRWNAPADIQAALTVLGERPNPRNHPNPNRDNPMFWLALDLHKTNLSGTILTGVLSHAFLRGANLSRADFNGTNLEGADMASANLTKSELMYANLKDAFLYCANLKDADSGSVDFTDASLTGANLTGAILSSAEGMTSPQVENALVDGRTQLPTGVARPVSNAPWTPDCSSIPGLKG